MPLPGGDGEALLLRDSQALREAYAYGDATQPLALEGVVLLDLLPNALDISGFWSGFTPTKSPARFIVALAAANMKTTQYEIRVGFDPRSYGFYEHEIDVWFDVSIGQSGGRVVPNFSDS